MKRTIAKGSLFNLGLSFIEQFIKVNPRFYVPEIKHRLHPRFSGCGQYTYGEEVIAISLDKCASLGYGGRMWSWPSYKIDRTPTGVICHEFGHFVDDRLKSISVKPDWTVISGIKKERVSGYEPDSIESFAESIRLFITNPDMLKRGAPTRYFYLTEDIGLVPRTNHKFLEVLEENGAPARQVDAAINWTS